MKAAVYRRYGPPEVVEVTEVEKPAPKVNEVLIRIRATSVTAADWRVRSLIFPPGFGLVGRLVFGIFGPRRPILGSEMAGEIEAVGRDVSKFAVGDQVFATAGAAFGAHAQYRALPEDGAIAIKPANLSYEEAAAIPFGGTTSLDFLREKGGIRRGETVLVVGASGGVGTAAVQLAKHFGAQVTGVCSTANLDLVKSIGADRVIDYTREDFTRNGETYDIIFDAAGTTSFAGCKDSLKPNGRLLLVLTGLAEMLKIPLASRKDGKKVVGGVASESAGALRFLAGLAETGEFRPYIDRRYPLERIAEAHAYVDTGRKRGNVIVTVAHGDKP